MSLGFTLAMPVGSRWQVYSHKAKASLGGMTVLSHLRHGVEVHWDAADKRGTLEYPLNNLWKLDGDHIRIADLQGQLLATFAPE